jgi:uncharacterized protein
MEPDNMRRRAIMQGCCAALLLSTLAKLPAAAVMGTDGGSARRRPAYLDHPLYQEAFAGLNPARCLDVHAHLAGIGDSASGIWVNPAMMSPLRHPIQTLQRQFYMHAAGVGNKRAIDISYVERLAQMIADFPEGYRIALFAFDHAYNDAGTISLEDSAFYVPDSHAQSVASQQASRFAWFASVHPYAPDVIERLDAARKAGAIGVKWLPSAHNIDPASPRCDAAYAWLAKTKIPLTIHCGEEKAVHGAGQHALVNPLRVRRALDHGVRLIVAHAATLGHAQDIDKGRNAGKATSFELFERLMNDPRYEKNLSADVSAVLQINRPIAVQRAIIERTEWHSRLLHGSDWPLPGLRLLINTRRFVEAGMLPQTTADWLETVRDNNPLLFEFLLKRHLRIGNKRLANRVFETAHHFEAAGPA